ncbi:hypothetical protein CALVIDRAFT_247197 [Calocera viscosa TUFC12733]|uniref:Uncharacterized protein n=1 Tax=Calocera viscosa (strain TUFC12733) TaxID=1330018 RepID=A0A167JK26_CALVF|nr:hypothetical protein CALVIDRAFT_247197 [Calocera viscosa TUFC12733]
MAFHRLVPTSLSTTCRANKTSGLRCLRLFIPSGHGSHSPSTPMARPTQYRPPWQAVSTYRSVVNGEDHDSSKEEDEANTRPPSQSLRPRNSVVMAPPRIMRLSKILWLAIFPFLIVGGLATLFVLWIILHRYSPWSVVWSQRAFQLDEGNNGSEAQLWGLTISSVLSEAVSLMAPFVLSLFAFRVARVWIINQKEYLSMVDGGVAQHEVRQSPPIPLDYGLIVSLMGAPSITTLYIAATRLFVSRMRSPGFLLWSAFIFSFFLFCITHLIGLCDLWLHASTTTVVTNTTTPLIGALSYGVGFNESLCPDGPIDSFFQWPCLVQPPAWADSAPGRYLQLNSLLVSTNSSLLSNEFVLPSVQTLADADNMAIAVPRQLNATYSFTAPSFGVRAACSAFTSKCQETDGQNTYGITNCSNAGYPQLPVFSNPDDYTTPIYPDEGLLLAHVGNLTMIGAIGGSDLPKVTDNSNIPYPNPVPLTLQLTWHTFTQDSAAGTFAPSCDAIGPWQSSLTLDGLAVFSSCNLSWYNITVQQSGGLYTLLDEDLSDPAFASVLWSPLLYQYATPHLENYLQSIALTQNNSDTLMRILEGELARQAMSMAASTFQPVDTVKQAVVGIKLLGNYPLAPVLTMFALIASLTIVLLLMAIWIVATSLSPVVRTSPDGGTRPTVLELTQLRLTTPLALAAQMFAKDPESSFKAGLVEMFEAEDPDEAVGIGLVDREGRQWFEVHNLHAELEKEPSRPILL